MICLASRLERLVCRTLCLEWCLLRRTICTSSSRCVCVCGGGGGSFEPTPRPVRVQPGARCGMWDTRDLSMPACPPPLQR